MRVVGGHQSRDIGQQGLRRRHAGQCVSVHGDPLE
jgi:hypothetical protein